MLSVLGLFLLMLQGPPPQGAAITGQLQAVDGSPAVAVRVSAIAAPREGIRPSDGQNYFATQAPVASTLTDATGRYRLTVPAGRYFVVAGILGQATYYPGTTDADAAEVVDFAPANAQARNFKLATRLGGRVRGRVTPPGASVQTDRAVLSGLRLGEILEAPMTADGSFEFGHVPAGNYMLSVFPTPPGSRSLTFTVGTDDPPLLEFPRPPVRAVRGRIVVQKGPLPMSYLAFSTPQSYVNGTINQDLTFTAELHDGNHQVEIGGLPSGYSIESVRGGSASGAITVGGRDVSDIVITVAAPRELPKVRGRIDGAGGRPVKVQLAGRIVDRLEVTAKPDGSFEFPAVAAGYYRLLVPELPSFSAPGVAVRASDDVIDVSSPAAR